MEAPIQTRYLQESHDICKLRTVGELRQPSLWIGYYLDVDFLRGQSLQVNKTSNPTHSCETDLAFSSLSSRSAIPGNIVFPELNIMFSYHSHSQRMSPPLRTMFFRRSFRRSMSQSFGVYSHALLTLLAQFGPGCSDRWIDAAWKPRMSVQTHPHAIRQEANQAKKSHRYLQN